LRFAIAAVPAALVPIRLPSMRRPPGTENDTTPLSRPDIRLRAAGVSPPMR
jgi:hypothetical protein